MFFFYGSYFQYPVSEGIMSFLINKRFFKKQKSLLFFRRFPVSALTGRAAFRLEPGCAGGTDVLFPSFQPRLRKGLFRTLNYPGDLEDSRVTLPSWGCLRTLCGAPLPARGRRRQELSCCPQLAS